MKLYGYKRSNGEIGFRNHVLILPAVACANSVASKIADAVEGAVAVEHESGCALIGHDKELFKRTLINYAKNPNNGGVLVIGLGCQSFSASELVEEIKKEKEIVEGFEIQEVGGIENSIKVGCKKAAEISRKISMFNRELVKMKNLVLGLQCGGSDPASGISANSALGGTVDRIIKSGGTAIMDETPEAIGTEHILAEQAADNSIGNTIKKTVKNYEKRIQKYGINLSDGQPARGNKIAGLTTIEEKSLGCINKLGSTTLNEVLKYAERPSKSGAIFMNSPGFDVYSVTGLVAGGAQIIAFTTGKGTPCGTPITPVIKISSNTSLYENMTDSIDINAGTMLEGVEAKKEVSEKIYKKIEKVANGKKTKSEVYDINLFGIWQQFTSV